MKSLWQCLAEIPRDRTERYLPFPQGFFEADRPCAMNVAGNGMTDFNIHDGDMVFFDPDKSPMPGDIVVVSPAEGKPMIVHQILVDLNRRKFCLHASGEDKRKNIYCTDPVIYGTVFSVKSKVRTDRTNAFGSSAKARTA